MGKRKQKRIENLTTPLTEVKGVGTKTADTLKRSGYEDAQKLQEADPEDLAELEGIGKATAEKIVKEAEKAVTEAIEIAKKAIDPQEHKFVPRHDILSEEEVDAFFEEYEIQPTNLPTIYISDAALKFMDVKIGDIIRITRESPTTGTSTYYRRVAYE